MMEFNAMKTMMKFFGALALTLMVALPAYPQTAPNMATTDTVQSLTNKSIVAPVGIDITAQTAPTTGVTATTAKLRTYVYKAVINYTAIKSAAVTADFTIGTLPAKSIIHAVTANVSEAFVCGSVCTTATLSVLLGTSAGNNAFLTSSDIDAAVANFEMVTQKSQSSTAVQAMVARFTSGTGNWGDATTSFLSAGNIIFNVVYSVYE